ncbi:ROK family transcriptional regulator [Sphaerisporangium sp. TRM90804]|uniref:ROK family transcriptional regulator n=1 Tax=Sphaerisporangium sp. TRM90804 TaxID=3031113 RepID=UPI0024491C3B|nr:ROK family transcriptional regulator [Sphaerisporangium sp. TRM90804]MDH2425158.1 ROK family transcriptional regulator [Sphaerisporangium sp. TRM90804]
MPQRPPGTPRLLRQLNDRAALELLLSEGPLTRAELGYHTGLSKVTSGQLLSRLEERGLVAVSGQRPGGRGPNAALYAVVPSSAYVAGLEVLPEGVTAGVADITGHIVAEATVEPGETADPVKTVHSAVRQVCDAAGISMTRLRTLVIGTRGVVDPRTGDVRFSFDLPSWHAGVLADLRATLGASVAIENDVNLAALAEHAYGAARGVDDFALLWVGVGQGLGVMLGSRLHRGHTGGAGEIGWLPVPGEPLPVDVTAPQSGSFQRLVGTAGLTALVRTHAPSLLTPLTPAAAPSGSIPDPPAPPGSGVDGVRRAPSSALPGSGEDGVSAESGSGADGIRSAPSLAPPGFGPDAVRSADLVRAAVETGADTFLDEVALRLAIGVAAVTVVLDPRLVVLSGDVGRAGGRELASRVERAVARICPSRPTVAVTAVEGNAVLRGAVTAALEQAREEVFSSTVDA